MSVLFGNTRNSTGSGYLIEFKAGRTLVQPGSESDKKKVVPIPKKGLVYIMNSSDNLLHFYWKNRDTNKNELDLILFPGDSEYMKVKECTDGRVFMLKFKSSKERHLFWMQEPNADRDDELFKKVNELLSNQIAQGSTRTGTDRSGANMISSIPGLSNVFGGSGDMNMSALNNMDQNQIMRLFSLMGRTGPGGAIGADQIPQLMFQSIKKSNESASNNTTPVEKNSTASASTSNPFTITADALAAVIAATTDSKQKNEPSMDLSTLFTRSNVQESIIKNADVLIPYLPDQSPILDKNTELSETIGSPQFQQASDFFGHALQTGQLGPALEQFNLKPEVVNAAKNGNFLKFAEKLMQQEQQSSVNKEINEHADSEETLESAAKKPGTSDKADQNIVHKNPKDDDMELD